ncbi:MAG TPA: hypothetical protein PLK19_11300 [Mycobacterium sp.]|jgi:hypothetical protein|nr:hypothetical protein [Gammaproteobacteria bacterium]HPY24897.1 hypothetical protein [Mycobacterium sp.]HPZ96256.1 hypothetical protein [Mycobacterium sp.]
MAESLRDKLAKNTAAAPQARAAQTFTTTPTGGSTDRERSADRNNSRTTVYLSPDLRRRLKIAAANTDRTMNDILIEATETWLSAHDDT